VRIISGYRRLTHGFCMQLETVGEAMMEGFSDEGGVSDEGGERGARTPPHRGMPITKQTDHFNRLTSGRRIHPPAA
jgi:hypothetical protein